LKWFKLRMLVLLEPSADEPSGGLEASQPVASESRVAGALVVGGCSCPARLGGVRALGRHRYRCGRVRAAWVLGVQSSVMSDNFQSTNSECAEPSCDHPFDSIQRADSHSTHATSTISLWRLDVVELPPCVWIVTVENLEQMQNGKSMMDIISALVQPWCTAQTERSVKVSNAASQCIISRLKKHLSLSLFRSPVKIIELCLLLDAAFATKYGIKVAPLFMTDCKNSFSQTKCGMKGCEKEFASNNNKTMWSHTT
jgi:hypothetical protein